MSQRQNLGDLPAIACSIGRRAGVLPAGPGPSFAIQAVRSKPGRGLAVSLVAKAAGALLEDQFLTLKMGEQALVGGRLRFGVRETERTPVLNSSPGMAEAPDLSLHLEVFPADALFPALVRCLDPRPGAALHRALQDAGKAHLGDPCWMVASVHGRPLRYKHGSRCVIAYLLTGADGRIVTVVGKAYAERERAALVHQSVGMLREQLGGTNNPLPTSLGIVGPLGLTLTEAVMVSGLGATLASSWRPRPAGSPHFLLADCDRRAARLAGEALARLHGAAPLSSELPQRGGSSEALKVRTRAERLIAWQPNAAPGLGRVSRGIACRLEAAVVDRQVVAHGGYKRAQLVQTAGRLFVTDLDGICLADPALDLGCFLAYLRPTRLFAGRQRCREWFEAAAAEFTVAHRDTSLALGRDPGTVAGALERARLYEASHLKIANRRVSRLNSPRPAELTAVCDEISACLSEPQRWS